jgi:hypothetical protein
MTRYNRNDFILKDKRDAFELELDSGEVVEFVDPNRLPAEDSFALETASSQESLRILLGDSFDYFWAEWKTRPIGELNLLTDAVVAHFRSQ